MKCLYTAYSLSLLCKKINKPMKNLPYDGGTFYWL